MIFNDYLCYTAWPYGIPRIMSSFAFESRTQSPPHDANFNTLSPIINADESCDSNWICEHRWRQTYNMVAFRNTVEVTGVNNWWDNGDNQIAFSRGNRGFIAFNGQYRVDLQATIQTALTAGVYCDLASGSRVGNRCTGTSVTVSLDGKADIYLSSEAAEGYIAISVDSKLWFNKVPEKHWKKDTIFFKAPLITQTQNLFSMSPQVDCKNLLGKQKTFWSSKFSHF